MPAWDGAAGASAESWKGSAILGPLPSMRAKLTSQPALNLRCLQDGCTGRPGQHYCKTCLELGSLCFSRPRTLTLMQQRGCAAHRVDTKGVLTLWQVTACSLDILPWGNSDGRLNVHAEPPGCGISSTWIWHSVQACMGCRGSSVWLSPVGLSPASLCFGAGHSASCQGLQSSSAASHHLRVMDQHMPIWEGCKQQYRLHRIVCTEKACMPRAQGIARQGIGLHDLTLGMPPQLSWHASQAQRLTSR